MPKAHPACTEPDCDRKTIARQLCRKHYTLRHRVGTLPTEWKKPPPYIRKGHGRTCEVPGCERGHLARRMCPSHYMMMRTHNITLDEYLARIEQQGGRCAICARDTRKFYIDHDHSCCDEKPYCGNCIRGILCSRCNNFMAAYDDDDFMAGAAHYVGMYRLKQIA